jgi:hypothetical protein
MKNDTIFPITRIVAALVVPFLWLAFIILWFFPDLTGERFAWLIKPHMTSMYIAAGYLGGSWLFLNALFGKRWHRIHGGFPPITIFTWTMLIATLLHWDRFSHGKLGFQLWMILYVVTPFLVPALWLYNRRTDPGTPEESDVVVAAWAKWLLLVVGAVGTIFALIGFLYPPFIISVWPWTLTPLTGRIMSGWLALLGVGALTMASDLRWTSWRVPLESILIWHVLVLVAVFVKASDFIMGVANWYTALIALMVAGIVFLYILMERKRRSTTNAANLTAETGTSK